MLHHVVLHEGRIHQKPVLFLSTFLRCNHNHSQMDTTCIGSINVCCRSMGDAPHGIFLVPKRSADVLALLLSQCIILLYKIIMLSSPAITVPATSICDHLLICQTCN